MKKIFFITSTSFYLEGVRATSSVYLFCKHSIPNPDPLIVTNHSIIVTDDKGCIDKTANQ
jgi:hypothetical protein